MKEQIIEIDEDGKVEVINGVSDSEKVALYRTFVQSARECVTSWPIEPVIACRYCHVTLERGNQPAQEHHASCPIRRLAVVLLQSAQ